MSHWHVCEQNRQVDVLKNPEFAKLQCGITYSHDMLNHKISDCKVDYIKYEYGDQIRLFNQLFHAYNIDRSNNNVIHIFLIWIECFIREFRGNTSGEVGEKCEEYIEKIKLEFFPSTMCLTKAMSDLNLGDLIENIKIIKIRQEKEELVAFKTEYLDKYLTSLRNERTRRRSLIFENKKEDVLR
jgi:hypothetical protein